MIIAKVFESVFKDIEAKLKLKVFKNEKDKQKIGLMILNIMKDTLTFITV